MESSIRTHPAGVRREITRQDFRRLYPQLHVQIQQMGISPAEVEDLIQETFLHAQKALDRGQFEGRSSFDTWVVSIAKKRALKHHRRWRADKRRAALVPLEAGGEAEGGVMAVAPEADPQTRASGRQFLDRVVQALAGLPEDFRAPLVLSVRGHTYEQIAAILRIPSSLVTSRIHQARAKLRKALSGTGSESGG